MARRVLPLTDTQIKAAKPSIKKKLFDGNGLFLLVSDSGSKLWRFRYKRPYTNKDTSLSFGRYPEVSLAEARKKRYEANKLVKNGIDPKEHKEQEKLKKENEVSNTFYKISQQLIDAKKAKGLKAASIRNFIAFMNNHIYPYLKNVPVNKITTSMVIKTLEHLKKIENHRSVLIGCSRINEVINYGVNLGIAKYNPITNVSKVFTAPTTKHATTLKPDEFPLFLKTLENALICEQVKNAMKLQIQTMTRPTETLSAMWCEFNIKQKTWTIPAERMKMKKEHKIHLSKQAIAILNYCKQHLPASAYVFPSIRGSKNKPMSKKGVISAIKIIGYEGRIVPHGFRSAASTTLNEQGFNFDVIESALSHKDTNAVRRAYNHAEYDKHKKELFNWWGDYVEKALNKTR